MSEQSPGAELVGLERGAKQYTCANPRCDEEFVRPLALGRPDAFHAEDCRRNAERDLRRTLAILKHHERQAEQLRARAGSYLRTVVEEPEATGGPTDAQRMAAVEAVIRVRGMARFLAGHQGEFARELLDLVDAVEPVIRA